MKAKINSKNKKFKIKYLKTKQIKKRKKKKKGKIKSVCKIYFIIYELVYRKLILCKYNILKFK